MTQADDPRPLWRWWLCCLGIRVWFRFNWRCGLSLMSWAILPAWLADAYEEHDRLAAEMEAANVSF